MQMMLKLPASPMRMKVIKIILFFLFLYPVLAQDNNLLDNIINDITVYDICNDKDGLWVASYGKGIFFIDKATGEIENYSSANGKIQNDLFYCIAANEKFVWAGSADGLFIYEKKNKRWTKRKFGKGGQYSNWIRSLKYDADDNVLWIGRFMYLTKYNADSHQYTDYDLTIQGNEKTNTIKAINVDGDSLVWFGTEGGLHKYRKTLRFESTGAVRFYDNKKNYFNGEGKSVSIADLLFEQKNIWIGLDEYRVEGNENYNIGGLYKFDRKNSWQRFDISDGLGGNGIYSLEKTGNFIWASTYQFDIKNKDSYGRGLVLINRTNLKITPLTNPSIPSTVYSLHFDGKDMWIGSNNGLYKITLINKLALWN